MRFEIDASRRRPISPYIYGTNQPNWQRGPLWTLVRWGGNRTSTYNWETNASNAGAEGDHQNDGCLSPSDVPGEPVRRLASEAFAAGASVLVTVPILGHVARDKRGDGDVAKTPDYLLNRFCPRCRGRAGVSTCSPICYDNRVYQDEFVNWLETTFPQARCDAGRTIFYALDNKPDLWWFNHARLHPEKTRYDEIVRLGIEYAAAIKGVAPQALVFGPVTCNWDGYDTLCEAPDAGGRDFLEFYLHEMHEAQRQSGRRLLDVLDLHWYPQAQGGGVRITEDDARTEVAAARVQAPRSLWDPSYMEDSWTTREQNARPHPLVAADAGEDRPALSRHAAGDQRVLLSAAAATFPARWPRPTCWAFSAARAFSPPRCGTWAEPMIASSRPPSPCSATTTARAARSATSVWQPKPTTWSIRRSMPAWIGRTR